MKIFEVTEKLDFDLVDDLTFFMEDDDGCYKTYLLPLEDKIEAEFRKGKSVPLNLFVRAVRESYKMYKNKFDMPDLPESLDHDTIKDCCIKLQDMYHSALANSKKEER